MPLLTCLFLPSTISTNQWILFAMPAFWNGKKPKAQTLPPGLKGLVVIGHTFSFSGGCRAEWWTPRLCWLVQKSQEATQSNKASAYRDAIWSRCKGGVTPWQKKKGVPSTSQTLFCVHSDTEGPSYTSVASIPTHSPHVVSTHGPSDADAALPGTDCESYQESGSSVHLTASDIASHQTTSTQCLSSSTGVPLQAFRSCVPSFSPTSGALLPNRWLLS